MMHKPKFLSVGIFMDVGSARRDCSSDCYQGKRYGGADLQTKSFRKLEINPLIHTEMSMGIRFSSGIKPLLIVIDQEEDRKAALHSKSSK